MLGQDDWGAGASDPWGVSKAAAANNGQWGNTIPTPAQLAAAGGGGNKGGQRADKKAAKGGAAGNWDSYATNADAWHASTNAPGWGATTTTNAHAGGWGASAEEKRWDAAPPAKTAKPVTQGHWSTWSEEARRLPKVTSVPPPHPGTVGARHELSEAQQQSQILQALLNQSTQGHDVRSAYYQQQQHKGAPPEQPKGGKQQQQKQQQHNEPGKGKKNKQPAADPWGTGGDGRGDSGGGWGATSGGGWGGPAGGWNAGADAGAGGANAGAWGADAGAWGANTGGWGGADPGAGEWGMPEPDTGKGKGKGKKGGGGGGGGGGGDWGMPEPEGKGKGKKIKKQQKQQQQQQNNSWGRAGWDDGWATPEADYSDDDMGDRRVHFTPITANLWGGSQHDSTYHMPSKTLAHAQQGMTTPLFTGTPRNKVSEDADVDFIDSRGEALQFAHQALFGRARKAKDRIHWMFSPQKDERVASLLSWIEVMSHHVGAYGVGLCLYPNPNSTHAFLQLHRFLQSREKGALIANADYRPSQKPNEPAFDWLTFDQLQATRDKILQESVAFYDPAVICVVFVFLPSKSGNSVAMWRRKIPIGNNLRASRINEISIAMAGLRREKDYVVHVDEYGYSPISILFRFLKLYQIP